MRFIAVTSLLIGSFLANTAMAADAREWLQRLSNAERNQSYQGTFIYERNGDFSSNAVWRQVEPGGQARERLERLDGSPREMLRVNGRTQCVSGAVPEKLASAQAWPADAQQVDKLGEWYDVRLGEESRVAGRRVVVLDLKPRDRYRYGVKLFLDHDTALPLKSLLLDRQGALLERLQFTRIDTAAVPSTSLLQPTADCHPVQLVQAGAQGRAQAWNSAWLPPGFMLSTVAQRRSPVSTDSVDWLVYDDGLARFSVFLEPVHDAKAVGIRSQLGPTAAVSRRLATAEGDVMVTVIGEIPVGTAERVAMSMRANNAQATR